MRRRKRWVIRLRGLARALRRWIHAQVPRRLWTTGLLAGGMLAFGTVGYRLIEGSHWTLFDGFYMTAITLTTIGYREVHDLSDPGRAFTVVLAYSGVFALFYFASELLRATVTGELRDILGRQWVDEELAKLKHHTIVCGYGRMGKIICTELDHQGKKFVVVDKGPLPGTLPYAHGLPIQGDATSDEILRKAGVDRARALVTAVGSDADNLYICLTARLLNSKLLIVARAEEEEAEVKLRKVGANKVISPYLAGGHRAVQAVLRPAVLHFMELATRPEFLDLQIEEIRVAGGCRMVGRKLSDLRIHQDLGIVIVGILKPSGELLYNPQGDIVVEDNVVLIALGQRKQLDRLEELATVSEPKA